MSLAIYEGSTLMNATFCEQRLCKLHEELSLQTCRPYNYKKIKTLKEDIIKYSDLLKKCYDDFENMSDEDQINFITLQMISRIKECNELDFSICFGFENECTTDISISNGCKVIFSTMLRFKKQVYDVLYDFNEEYDGYYDTAKYVVIAKSTPFLNDVESRFVTKIKEHFPEANVSLKNNSL